MTTYDFDCGCKIPVLDNGLKEIDGLPSLEIDFYNLNHQCPRTWQVFCDGKTKGVFQLEKSLGRNWSKKMAPVCLDEVAALISIIRPGCLKAIVDGKNMTQHFIDRKNGEEPYEDEMIHPLLLDILKDTYGVSVYQEQSLKMAKVFAGYSLIQADNLRKAIGKKKADVMAQNRSIFIEGCKNTGIIEQEDAEYLFDIIEKSNRYSFNKAHAMEYAETGYWCAYAKAHFPLHFFCSWLSMANDKQKPREEVAELIQDAKSYGIEAKLPSLFSGNDNFIIEDGALRFGVGNVKSVGFSKVADTLIKVDAIEKEVGKKISDMTWYEMLIYVLPNLQKTVVNNLMSCGALSKYGMQRKEMLFQYNRCFAAKGSITERELNWIKTRDFDNIQDAVAGLSTSGIPNKTRVETVRDIHSMLKNPPEKLEDSVDWISGVEQELLGIAITCSKLDGCDTSAVNCTCAQFSDTALKSIVMALQIDRVTEWRAKTENSKPMCFITAHDNTGSIEISVGANEYEENNFLLFVGNTVIFSGYKNKKGSLAVRKVTQI